MRYDYGLYVVAVLCSVLAVLTFMGYKGCMQITTGNEVMDLVTMMFSAILALVFLVLGYGIRPKEETPTPKTTPPVTHPLPRPASARKIFILYLRARSHYLPFIYLCLIAVAFLLCFLSLSSVHLENIPTTDEFWIWRNIPLSFWLGLTIIVVSQFCAIPLLDKKYFKWIFVFSSGLLMICIRMIFTVTMNKPFVWDSYWYIDEVQNWLNNGVYSSTWWASRNYPVSFFISYVCTKLGLSLYYFFKWAPSAIYMVNTIIVFFLVKEISGSNRVGAVATLLFSTSSGAYVTWHYSPCLVGTVFYLLSLYLVIRNAKKGFNVKNFILSCFVMLSLILTHHLSALYLFFTLAGLSIGQRFFKVYSKKASTYLVFAFLFWYTFSVWHMWTSIVDPARLFEWFTALVNSIHGVPTLGYTGATLPAYYVMPLLDKISFLVYPLSYLGLATLGIVRYYKSDDTERLTFVAMSWNCIISVILVFGLVAHGVMEPFRMLEIFLLGVLPLSAKSFLKLGGFNSLNKKKLLIFCLIILFITFMNIHRLYRSLERLEESLLSA